MGFHITDLAAKLSTLPELGDLVPGDAINGTLSHHCRLHWVLRLRLFVKKLGFCLLDANEITGELEELTSYRIPPATHRHPGFSTEQEMLVSSFHVQIRTYVSQRMGDLVASRLSLTHSLP